MKRKIGSYIAIMKRNVGSYIAIMKRKIGSYIHIMKRKVGMKDKNPSIIHHGLLTSHFCTQVSKRNLAN